ncbi:zinc finger BED domain-containing protein 4-like [Epinephelus lanceolatus]
MSLSLFCRYLEYKAGPASLAMADTTQQTISSFAQRVHLYAPNSSRQQAITQAILQDLVIGCSLPLSLVENPNFRHFLSVMDCKYTPVSRTSLTEKQIPYLVSKVKDDIIKALEAQASVALTTDLWSDRRLRSFLGVTAHIACEDKDSYSLKSFLLDCRRFTGKHCGERIASEFDEIVEEYGISNKISFILTDNASNMKRAFKVRLSDSEQPESDSDDLDDEMMWEDVEDFEQPWSSGERLSCFAHSLQLVVSDGMKEVKAIARAIAKATKFTTLLHSSSKVRDMFETHFGANKSIPAANNTRWNSTLKQLKALTTLDHRAVTEMCSECDTENIAFSVREWAQLKDLCTVLEPFSEATDLTEGDTVVTISMVVPTVLDLRTHLNKMEVQLPQIVTIVRALKKSLEKRFSGIFRRINMEQGDPEEPFNHRIYFLAAMLDPQFGLSWVDLDVHNGESSPALKRFRDDLKKSLTDLLIREVDRDATAAPLAEDAEDAGELCHDSPPPLKHQRLLSRYKAFKMQHSTTWDSSITAQISKYLDNMNDYDCDALTFWSKNQEHFPQLHNVALKVLSIPASSAPVERVFSRGGILMRPHRARLGHKMLQFLVFLKCNQRQL